MEMYRAKKGAMIDDEDAQRYGERIAQIEAANQNTEDLPGLIIDDAHSDESPLNEYFEWDNEKAGWKYRRHQAQMLLCSIEVKIINPNRETEEYTRAFHPVKITVQESKDTKPYEISTWTNKTRILSEPELRKQIIGKAMDELNMWRARYDQYTELSTVFDAIQQVRMELK